MLENFITSPWLTVVLVPVMIWSVIWKGLALWKSARHNQLTWFIILLVVNTVGVLEIIYIAFFQKNIPGKKRSRRK